MVLETEQYNDGYKQQNYSAYEGPTGSSKSYEGVSEYTHPNPSPFQMSTYPSSHGAHLQSGWSTGNEYYGNGVGHYPGGNMGGPMKPTIDGHGSSYYEKSYAHGNSHHQSHETSHAQGYQSHGSPPHKTHVDSHGQGYEIPPHLGHGSPPHQGHGSPHGHGYGSSHGYGHSHESTYGQGQGHGSPLGFGKTHGLGGPITNQINKLTHGRNNYRDNTPNYRPSPTGFNHGYRRRQPSWTHNEVRMDAF